MLGLGLLRVNHLPACTASPRRGRGVSLGLEPLCIFGLQTVISGWSVFLLREKPASWPANGPAVVGQAVSGAW